MLVLSRHRYEGVTIAHPAGNIHVTVVEIRGDKVRIGFECDPSIPIHRDEVWAAIQRQTQTKLETGEIDHADSQSTDT